MFNRIRAIAARLGAGAFVLVLCGGCPPVDPDPNDLDPNGVPVRAVTLSPVAEGFASPVDLVAPDDGSGRLFIVDQTGRIWVVTPQAGVLPTPLLDLRAMLDTLIGVGEERGLLGMALHPQFNQNRRFYVYYNTPPSADAPFGSATEVRLSEFLVSAANPNAADPASERVLLRVAKPQTNHNGGQIRFGPDGFLYIGLGDGGGSGDSGFGHTPDIGNAQDKSNLLGAILRIDVNASDPYAVPASNPFVGVAGAAEEVYAYGLRNPWRFSFDATPGGGVRLFAADVGQNLMEEIDLILSGGNYGWNRKEGSLCFDPAAPNDPPDICLDNAPDGALMRDPILEYGHRDAQGNVFGSAVVGGYVYRGTDVPELAGLYVFGDFSAGSVLPNGRIFAAQEQADGTWVFDDVAVDGAVGGRLGRYLLAFGRDAEGELYVLTRTSLGPSGTTGVVLKIVDAR